MTQYCKPPNFLFIIKKEHCILIAQELGYVFLTDVDSYLKYYREKDGSVIYIGNADIELEGYPTALYYKDALTKKEQKVVKDFINCNITVSGSSVKDINTIWKKVIVLPNSGIKRWTGGAYTLAFIYSNKGNFLVKGYRDEIGKYLLDLKSKGYKYFVNHTLWSNKYVKQHRSIWQFYKDGVYVCSPEPKQNERNKWFGWRITNFNDINLEFKRLPKRWIDEFDKI